ncbi:MAG TPA: TOBE domain-containing protein [Candidatus Angelobacter sp.]|jgi:molybdopterin-binding protein
MDNGFMRIVNLRRAPLESRHMRLSARNQLEGVIEDIQLGGVMAHVSVRVGNIIIDSVITRRSAEEMALKKGDKVKAVIKTTEVMLLKD